jgi:DNA adenine methylase
MVYMGSKAKYAKYIVPKLQQIIDENGLQFYWEPFVGGANIIDKIKCDSKLGTDKNIPLIALHRQAQDDPSIIPAHGNREWWDEAKEIYRRTNGQVNIDDENMPAWKIGAIAFFASFSNGGFARGYAKNSPTRDYYNEAYRNFMAQIREPEYKNIHFEVANYDDVFLTATSGLIYCDPPYQNTKPYGYKFETDFDYEKYWNWVRQMSKYNFVVVSEQVLSDDAELLWEADVKRTAGKDNNFKATEKLGIFRPKNF